jgi:hypothetical protein
LVDIEPLNPYSSPLMISSKGFEVQHAFAKLQLKIKEDVGG